MNDVSDIQSGKARLTIRHTALAPAVDIPLSRGGNAKKTIGIIENLVNGSEGGPLDVRPGGYTYSLDVEGLGTVFGPNFLELPDASKSYIVYAVGTYPETFGLIVQVLDLDNVAPGRSEVAGSDSPSSHRDTSFFPLIAQ